MFFYKIEFFVKGDVSIIAIITLFEMSCPPAPKKQKLTPHSRRYMASSRDLLPLLHDVAHEGDKNLFTENYQGQIDARSISDRDIIQSYLESGRLRLEHHGKVCRLVLAKTGLVFSEVVQDCPIDPEMHDDGKMSVTAQIDLSHIYPNILEDCAGYDINFVQTLRFYRI